MKQLCVQISSLETDELQIVKRIDPCCPTKCDWDLIEDTFYSELRYFIQASKDQETYSMSLSLIILSAYYAYKTYEFYLYFQGNLLHTFKKALPSLK